ncbi:PD-(D/E)XK nuclease family protein [Candidatus Azobacteroides pseudotrichonymphae]|uniref:PD-(D/E)XK endonuclease-like domain-containing protein n=1 Tax=Azobacteroides pseudotrichonymphae genomovar. CFP2 TaxID=511995 RepID=B6YS00_AZOPC|nr:PD-(D/E)XK nuclease family protein [Candidatus Azobacteroides pseudotrichonymphae]BAG83972.1 conserved hypothetical protein [Candidatus Azobacteroides pseudotrichonymphae genomovar. CFP2]
MNKYSPTPFLYLVAENLISRFGTDLSDIVVVFPGMRAKLFLNNYLHQYVKVPLWSPQYQTIESLFTESSPLQIGDDILLISELYKIYNQIHNKHFKKPFKKTLDEFFFFGETLLNDFDEIDKNNIDAKLLFGNLQDLSTLRDNLSHLSENQIQALIHHFKHIFQNKTPLQNNFRNIWNMLGEVYTSFKTRLKEKNISYPGMLMRQVVENTENLFKEMHYAFVGFNALNKCEEQLFELLKEKSSFYWDYDKYYLETEAGQFIKYNIHKFNSSLPPQQFDTFLNIDKKITFLNSFSESGQSAVIPQWINSLQKESSFIQPNSAIILCNETILPTIIHTIPPNTVENINITMGFPIVQTAISGFLQILIEMQIKGYSPANQSFGYKYVLSVLRHPYTTLIFPKALEVEKELIKNNIFFPTLAELQDEILFTYVPDTLSLTQYLLNIIQKLKQSYKNKDTNIYAGLYQESIYSSYIIINRLYRLLSTENLNIGKTIFSWLLRKYLSETKVPFNGNPVKGLQIMGVLETRTLDFNNLIIFNVNEGYMPGHRNENTFIPQFLRKHFRMYTVEHQDSIYAYYFYRLITRAQNITLVYTTNETQIGKAEMSRFLLQLLVDPRLKDNIERFTLQASVIPMHSRHITIDKDKSLLEKIKNKYDLNTNIQAKSLSPTILSCFISCPYHFYLEYIQELRNKTELSSETDNSIFGSIFHQAAKLLYQQIGTRQIDSKTLDMYTQSPQYIRNIALEAFQREFFKRQVKEKDYNGKQLINLHVICKMLDRLVRFDQKHTPFSILELEFPINGSFPIKKGNIHINIGGVIDRLQEKDGKHIIIDYKTGHEKNSFKNLSELLSTKHKHIFQAFIYATLYSQKEKNKPIVPVPLYIQRIHKKKYSPILIYNNTPVDNFNKFEIDFKNLLFKKIEELFDPNIPFQQTKTIQNCEYCSFKERCNRY